MFTTSAIDHQALMHLHTTARTTPSHVRSSTTETAALLSRLRLGGEHLTEEDWQLLEARVCGKPKRHCGKEKCCKFDDEVLVSRARGKRTKRRTGSPSEEVTQLLHCPILPGATVIAALREKVNTINAQHIEQKRKENVRIHKSEAVDTGPMGLPIANESVMAATDKKARSQLRTLSVYAGMSALLTINAVCSPFRTELSPDEYLQIDRCTFKRPVTSLGMRHSLVPVRIWPRSSSTGHWGASRMSFSMRLTPTL